MLRYLFFYLIVIPLRIIFFFLTFNRFYWYRRLKGGEWYKFTNKDLPKVIYWTRDESSSSSYYTCDENHGKIKIK